MELGALHFYLAALFYVEAKEEPRVLKAWGHLGLNLNPHRTFGDALFSLHFNRRKLRHREVIKVSQDTGLVSMNVSYEYRSVCSRNSCSPPPPRDWLTSSSKRSSRTGSSDRGGPGGGGEVEGPGSWRDTKTASCHLLLPTGWGAGLKKMGAHLTSRSSRLPTGQRRPWAWRVRLPPLPLWALMCVVFSAWYMCHHHFLVTNSSSNSRPVTIKHF